jgi:hypothetical protein
MLSKLQVSKPTIFLFGFIFVAQLNAGFNAAQVGLSTAFNYWYVLTLFFALAWWFINDSRNHDIKWDDEFLDMGMFLYIAWVFILPYYLIKTRGWKKALFMIGFFLIIFFGAAILGGILSFLINFAKSL